MTITKKNFREVVDSGDPVLIDFWAPWCGPCRMASPIVEEVAEEAAPGVKVGKVDIESEPELADLFGVMSIPTLIVLRNKKVAARSVGLKSKRDILEMIRT